MPSRILDSSPSHGQGLDRGTDLLEIFYPFDKGTSCPWCEEKFNSGPMIKIHCVDHHQIKQFVLRCRHCEFSTSTFDATDIVRYQKISSHIAQCKKKHNTDTNTQQEPRPFQCQIGACYGSFDTQAGLSQHIRHRHPDEYNAQLPKPSQSRSVWTRSDLILLATISKTISTQIGSTQRARLLQPYFSDKTTEQIRIAMTTKRYKDIALLENPVSYSSPSSTSSSDEETEQKIFSTTFHHTVDPPEDPPIVSAADIIDINQDVLNHLQMLLNEDNGNPQIAAANRYVRLCLGSGETNEAYNEFIASILPIKEKPAATKPPKTRPAGPMNARKRKQCDYRENQELFNKNPSGLINKILHDAPTKYDPPNTKLVHATYSDRFGQPKSDNTPITDLKSCNDLEDQTRPISLPEIRRSLRKMNFNSAPGLDRITTKHLRKIHPTIWCRVFNLWFYLRQIPNTIKTCRTTLIPKGRDHLDDINNWRPITIGSMINRLYAKILDRRIKPDLNWKQKAFQPIDGCGEHVALLNAMIHHSRQTKQPIGLVFLDIAKAFDTVPHDTIFRALHRHQVQPQLIDVIKDMYTNSTTSIMASPTVTESIPILRGVKQGCPLSPKLFNMVMDELLDSLPEDLGYQFQGTRTNALAFADDVVLISTSQDGIARLLETSAEFFHQHGLRINPSKCLGLALEPVKKRKIMKVMTETQWVINNIPVPMVPPSGTVRYLGVHLSPINKAPLKLPDIVDWMKRLRSANLKPTQKLILLRTHVLPRLIFPLSTHAKTTKTLICQIDRKLRNGAREFLHLPKCTHRSFFHLPVRLGGLGIPSLARVIPIQKIQFINRMITSTSESVLDAINHDYWNIQKTRILRWINKPTWPNKQETKKLKMSLLEKDLSDMAKSQQGQGYSQISKNPTRNHWLFGYNNVILPQQDFINGCKLLSNNLPTLSNTYRGHPNANKSCRRCKNVIEYQSHVLQTCKPMADAITERHNNILYQLEHALLEKEFKVHKEPIIVEPETGNRFKPDLIVINDKQGWIVDVQIPYENDRQNLKTSYNYKKNKYTPIIPIVEARYNLLNCTVNPIVIGARGTWCGLQNHSWSEWSLTSKQKQIFSILAIRGSLRIWKIFQIGLRLDQNL